MSTTDTKRVGELLDEHTDLSEIHKYVFDNGRPSAPEYEIIRVAGSHGWSGTPIVVSPAVTEAERTVVEEAVTAVEPQPKCCFTNVLRLWQYDSTFSYVEGFAVAEDHDILYEHAWNTLNGKIVDVTVGAAPFSEYFGVEFDTPGVLDHYYEFGEQHDVWRIIGNHRDKFQYLRERGYIDGEVAGETGTDC